MKPPPLTTSDEPNVNTLMEKVIKRGIARQRMSLPPIEEMKELLPPSEDLLGQFSRALVS